MDAHRRKDVVAGLAPPEIPEKAALYLDFDGTLIEFGRRPELVVVPRELLVLLSDLADRYDGALAIVTGRALSSVDALLTPLVLRGAGLHGAELRPDPALPARVLRVPQLPEMVAELGAFARSDERLLIEDKAATVALHFRLAPERSQDCEREMRRLAARFGFEVIVGHCVVEARLPGISKGSAILELSQKRPYLGRTAVFVGDDTTDEDGFEAVQSLGGISVKVGPGATRARYRLESVGAVHQWLHRAVEGKQGVDVHGRLPSGREDSAFG